MVECPEEDVGKAGCQLFDKFLSAKPLFQSIFGFVKRF